MSSLTRESVNALPLQSVSPSPTGPESRQHAPSQTPEPPICHLRDSRERYEPATRPVNRRFNRRRPSTSPEEPPVERFASLSLQNPRQSGQRVGATIDRPRLARVFVRRHFGSAFSPEQFARDARRNPAHRGNTKKLFLYTILLLREEPEQLSVARAWALVRERLIQAGVYTNRAEVDAAWSLAFNTRPSGLFERLMTEELEVVYARVAGLLAED